jgi:prepilin-type N-terminal cleavage/methylation domain-containing protein
MLYQPGKSIGRSGFTLIELTIVVVIIGILAAIAIPKFNIAANNAKVREADLVLKHVYQAQLTFIANNNSGQTSDLTDLESVGYSAPAHMEFYVLPAVSGYALPLCLTSKGAWPSRQIDPVGQISDC